MSLGKRLNEMERRIRELEQWKDGIEQALMQEQTDPEDQGEVPLTLDGEAAGGERDRFQSLG